MAVPSDYILKILVVTLASFTTAMLLSPALIRVLRKLKIGKTIRDEKSAPIAAKLHAAKAGTPNMGGLVIWVTTAALTLLFSLTSWNFLSRGQTWLPLGAMIAAALVGLVDDYLNVKKIGPAGGGLRMRHRIISYGAIALTVAVWFYTKLGWDTLHIPFTGTFQIGWLYIPAFVLVIVATQNAVNITDGLDGLAGGPLVAAFTAYAVIAALQGKFDLAVFCAAIIGALMAFLWFNVTPAQFFMGDTGAMSLGTVLGIVAMLTNQPLLLIIIGFPFVIETCSVIIQLASKKIRKKKVFLSAPLHHHLEASGWTEPQIVFRFWLMSMFAAGVGVILALIDRI